MQLASNQKYNKQKYRICSAYNMLHMYRNIQIKQYYGHNLHIFKYYQYDMQMGDYEHTIQMDYAVNVCTL